MLTQSILPGRVGGRHTASAAAILTTLFGIVPAGTLADQPAATKTVSVADVSLADLNLSTAAGMRLTRDRLHTMAERICADGGGGRAPSPQPAFGACVDNTVADALRHIDALGENHMRVLDTLTLGARVSLADLDLSTPEGAGLAHQRLDAVARRLCAELARRRDLVYPRNTAVCVHDTLAAALAQADALAARSTRAGRRSAP